MVVNNRIWRLSQLSHKRLKRISRTIECPITLFEMYRWQYYRYHRNLDSMTIHADHFAYNTFEASKIKAVSMEDLTKQRR